MNFLEKGVRVSFFRIIALFTILAVVGCGGEKKTSVKPPVSPAATTAKAALQEIAQSGERGSGMMTLRESLEQLKQTDAAKGSALLSDLNALEKATDAAAVKAQAKAMADKL